LRLFSFGGYELALAALALVVFGAYDSYPRTLPFGLIVMYIVFFKKTFFLNGVEKKQAVFSEKNVVFFLKSWKNSSRVVHNVKLLQNWCVVLRLDSSWFSF